MPIDVNGINKLAAEYYHLLYHGTYGIRSTVLRLTNTFGPRQQIRSNRQGFATIFLRQACAAKRSACTAAAGRCAISTTSTTWSTPCCWPSTNDACLGQIFNLGSKRPYSLRAVRRHARRSSARSRSRSCRFPRTSKIIDIGDYYGDFSRFRDADRLAARGRPGRRAGTNDRLLPRAQGSLLAMTHAAAAAIRAVRLRRAVRGHPGRDSRRRSKACWLPARSSSARSVRAVRGELRPLPRRDGQRASAWATAPTRWPSPCGRWAIGPGDEVITVANTAIPTVSAIRMVGAPPVFCDIDPHTLLMDLDDAESRITPRTRAIVPVHLYGNAVDMTRLMTVAQRGTAWPSSRTVRNRAARPGNGQMTGTFGDVGCFSFYPTKNLGAYGDGGLCFTRTRRAGRGHAPDPRVRLRRRRIDCAARRRQQPAGRAAGRDPRRQASPPARLSGQPPRKSLASTTEQLAPSIARPRIAPQVDHSYHLFVIVTDEREQLIAQLDERGHRLWHPLSDADPPHERLRLSGLRRRLAADHRARCASRSCRYLATRNFTARPCAESARP